MWLLAMGLTLGAQAGETCDAWGDISPQSVNAFPTNPFTFRISGSSGGCGDPETCEWWLDDNGVGTLDIDVGSPVIWTAPDDASVLEGCVPLAFSIYARCVDGDTLDSAVITLMCTEEDKLRARAADSQTSVGGGGCNSPTRAMVLLGIPLLLLRRPSG